MMVLNHIATNYNIVVGITRSNNIETRANSDIIIFYILHEVYFNLK